MVSGSKTENTVFVVLCFNVKNSQPVIKELILAEAGRIICGPYF
jgi:hypothetical protein